ncbi:hypothetical protein L6164_016293 [Bauhinia variegata]|uniref:Uncharacterized protein n=1 Tax=Bauhinia variegata TaxID=167791 RepID=A0ACB9NPL1_BAUVA|nr:hypothetical protein L6164_016293 [Bauhinia variegata]
MLFSSFPPSSSSCQHNSIFLGNGNNMDFSDISTGKSPRRELQGPRPTPLRVNKDSHKIKKPPLAPQPPAQQPPPRQPVIIYTVSPKIIHTTPADFMNLVQRLTGSSSSSSSSDMDMASTNDPFNGNNGGAISPAARFATIENARSPQGNKQQHQSVDMGDVEGIEMGQGLERQGMFQGILSPGPSALSPIPSSFFSPATPDPNLVSFFHDLSPVLHGNRNFMEGSFMPSPSNFVSPHAPSIDLFNNFFD